MPPSQPMPAPTLSPPPPLRKPQKITQLLCLDQNQQLKSIFTTWMSQSFKYLPNLLSSIYLQLQLLINFIEYRFTVARDKPQVGDYLQNIKYGNMDKKMKIVFLLLDVVGPYLKRRLVMMAEKIVQKYEKDSQQYEQQRDNNDQKKESMTAYDKFVSIIKKLLQITSLCDKLYALASFLNLAIFIKQGRYRSITQRLLTLPMSFVNPESSRVLDFTLMNRNIIWQIYQMVLKHILPYLYKFLGSGLKNVFYLHSYMGVEDSEEGCGVCGDVPTMALKAEPCGHFFCYYCTKGQKSDSTPVCKKCGENVQNWAPLYA